MWAVLPAGGGHTIIEDDGKQSDTTHYTTAQVPPRAPQISMLAWVCSA